MQDSLFKYEIYALKQQIISLEIKIDFMKCIIYNFNDIDVEYNIFDSYSSTLLFSEKQWQ